LKKDKKLTEEIKLEDDDYYFENDLMVLTEKYLKKRRYCCSNGCRHCPYQDDH
jgi:hypothetical protein